MSSVPSAGGNEASDKSVVPFRALEWLEQRCLGSKARLLVFRVMVSTGGGWQCYVAISGGVIVIRTKIWESKDSEIDRCFAHVVGPIYYKSSAVVELDFFFFTQQLKGSS